MWYRLKKTVIMWHEARRQERKIRVMMVDYQKRADRRRQFYEQIVRIAAVLLYDAVENQFCCHKLDDIPVFWQ